MAPRPHTVDGERDVFTFLAGKSFTFEPHGLPATAVPPHPSLGRGLQITTHKVFWQVAATGTWIVLRFEKLKSVRVTGGALSTRRVHLHLKSGASVGVQCDSAFHASALHQQVRSAVEMSANAVKGIVDPSRRAAPQTKQSTLEAASSKIDSQIANLEERIASADDEIRQLVAKQSKSPTAKARGLLVIKKKKVCEQQRDQLLGMQLQMVTLQCQQDQASVNAIAAFAMQNGVKVIQQQHQKIGGVEGVEAMNDDLQDVADDWKGIADTLGANTGVLSDEDADLAVEYARMQEELAAQTLAQSLPPLTPIVASGVVAAALGELGGANAQTTLAITPDSRSLVAVC